MLASWYSCWDAYEISICTEFGFSFHYHESRPSIRDWTQYHPAFGRIVGLVTVG